MLAFLRQITMWNKNLVIYFISVLLLLTTYPTGIVGNNYDEPKYTLKTIVLDPGHGGEDPGAVGRTSKEKDIVLNLCLRLGKMIEEEIPGVRVLYTRTTDVRIDLKKRADFANDNNADLFISVHVNGFRNRAVAGTETFVSGFNRLGDQDAAIRENASILFEENYEETYGDFNPTDPESYIIFSLMKNQFREQSIRFATFVQDEYRKSGRVDRGVKEQSLAVLAYTGMPAILTEIGFISHAEDEKHMNSEKGQEELAKELLLAIKSFKRVVER